MTDVNTIKKSTGNDGTAAVENTFINKFNILNLTFYILNSLATYSMQFGWLPLANMGDLSDKYQTIITPGGTSFAIWGVIFMWQLFWVGWQFLPSQRNSEGVIKAWYFYPLFTVCQTGWTFSFALEIMWLAMIFMTGILVILIAASMSLQTYKKTWKGYLIWQFPFSIQTGWIMAASTLNLNLLPVFYKANALTQMIFAGVSLTALVITAFTWLSSYPVDFAIPCVILWALCGIYVELNAPLALITDTFSERQINGIHTAVLVGMIAIAVGIVSKAMYVLIVQRPAALKASAGDEKKLDSDSNSKDVSEEGEVSAEESV